MLRRYSDDVSQVTASATAALPADASASTVACACRCAAARAATASTSTTSRSASTRITTAPPSSSPPTAAAPRAARSSPGTAERIARVSAASPAARTGRARGSEYVDRATWASGKTNAVPRAASGPQRGPTTSEPSRPTPSRVRPKSSGGSQKTAAAPPTHQATEYQADGPMGNCGWMAGRSGVPTE